MGVKRSRLVLPPAEYKALCNEVHTRDKWRCAVPQCRRRSSLHSHHVVYRSHGGNDVSQNLITLCNTCHDAVHNRFMLVMDKVTGLYEDVNANTGVRFTFLAGWRPSRTIR
jgi:5-methylcytosine-specific restriction endonuclease McrA